MKPVKASDKPGVELSFKPRQTGLMMGGGDCVVTLRLDVYIVSLTLCIRAALKYFFVWTFISGSQLCHSVCPVCSVWRFHDSCKLSVWAPPRLNSHLHIGARCTCIHWNPVHCLYMLFACSLHWKVGVPHFLFKVLASTSSLPWP